MAICLFVIWILPPPTGISERFGPGHDGYIQLAENIGRGNGYVFEKGGPPVFHRPPLYPLLLVPAMFLPAFLQRVALVLMQSLMVGAIGALIFRIAKRLFNTSTASTAVVILMLNPWVYWNAKNPMTAALQALLYTLLAALVGVELLRMHKIDGPQAFKTRVWGRGFVLGAVAGALALTHGAMLAVDVVLLLVLFIIAFLRRHYAIVKISIIAAIIMTLSIAPWTYRNWRTFGRFIPIASGSGLAYFNGNVHWNCIIDEPQRKGESYIDASLRVAGIEGTEKTHTHWKGLKDIELDDRVNKKMVEHMRAHPVALLKKVVLNAIEYYFPACTYPFLAVKNLCLEKLALTVFHIILWGLVLAGFWGNNKEAPCRSMSWFMLGAVALYAIWYFPFATFIGHSLYTLGTIPLLSILAAHELESLHYKGNHRYSQTSAS